MKPADLLDPAKLPEELQWVSAHYRLHPDDPVYLLIAWHWQRVKASEDTLQAAIVEMKTALDARLEALAGAADTIVVVKASLVQVQKELANRPAILALELEEKLQQPVSDAVTQLAAMGKSLGPVAQSFRSVQHRHLLATLLIGFALGVIATFVLLHA